MIEVYGKSSADKLAEENLIARKIIKEISEFGISERQKHLILYYLSLELEDINTSQVVSSFLKENLPNLTITGLYEGD